MIKIISGGQTGVDRAALDVAIKLGIPHGGWCPKNRLSETGPIPAEYLLKETNSCEYSERTKFNIRDSDGTMILIPNDLMEIKDGTILTLQEVEKMSKPHLALALGSCTDILMVMNWISGYKIEILNVAGPRESQVPGIYTASFKLLETILSQIIKSTKC